MTDGKFIPSGLTASDIDRTFNSSAATDASVKERATQRMLANIHAVAKHLLNVGDHAVERKLFVGVQPLGQSWRVQVSYADFVMGVKSPSLDEALEKVLQKLVSEVSSKLEESTRIISALDGKLDTRATIEGIRDVVRRVKLVKTVDVSDSNQPGVVDIVVALSRPTSLLERDEVCLEIGAKLERIRAVPIKYAVEIRGQLTDGDKHQACEEDD